jgi:hypothetical protein
VLTGFIWHGIGPVVGAYQHHTESLGSLEDEKSLTILPTSSFSKRTMHYGVSKLICFMFWPLIVNVIGRVGHTAQNSDSILVELTGS